MLQLRGRYFEEGWHHIYAGPNPLVLINKNRFMLTKPNAWETLML